MVMGMNQEGRIITLQKLLEWVSYDTASSNILSYFSSHSQSNLSAGEWDRVGGLAGLGGVGTPFESSNGKNGAVRIIKPGHY